MTRVERRFDPFLVALARGDLWTVSLAGFLVRGGVLLFLVPIVVIPSPLDVANLLGRAVTAAALGGPNPDLVRLAATASVATAAVIVVAFALGAAMDVSAVRVGAAELAGRPVDALIDRPASGGGSPGAERGVRAAELGRAFAVRLLSLVPFAATLGLLTPTIVGATYGELIDPTDLVTPLVLRIVIDLPAVVAALVVTWLAGEVVGGLAVRFVVLEGRGTVRAIAGAIGLIARRPIASLGALALGSGIVVVLVGPALAASALAWRWVAFSLRAPDDVAAAAVGILVLTTLWLGGLVLAGFAATVRGLLWTAVAVDR